MIDLHVRFRLNHHVISKLDQKRVTSSCAVNAHLMTYSEELRVKNGHSLSVTYLILDMYYT